MVRKILVLVLSASALTASAQQCDSILCNELFHYFDSIQGSSLITLWDSPPTLYKGSGKAIEEFKEENCCATGNEIVVSIIVGSDGLPQCIRYSQSVCL